MQTGHEFSRTCIIAGCDNPRTWVATGKESRYCKEHLEAIYERAAARRSNSAAEKRRKKQRKCERVVIVDYGEDCLFFVSGEIENTETLPETDIALQRRLATLASEGYRIARPHPFRQTDIDQTKTSKRRR